MRALTITLFLMASFTGFSQTKWSLEKCIEAAIENNLTVQRSELNVELAESNYLRQKGAYLPSVNGYAGTSINFGKTIDPFTNTFATDQVRADNYGIQSNWELFNGMQRFQTYKQTQYEVAASKYDADKTRNDITLATTQAFLDIVFNRELKKVADEQVLLTSKQVDRTQKLVDAGSVPMGSLMDMQAQMAQEELNSIKVENNLKLAYLKLLILMRMDTLENFEIDVPEIDAQTLTGIQATPSLVYFKALDILPEVKGAEIRYLAAEKNVSSAKGRLSPVLSFNASLGSGYSGKNTNSFGEQVSDNFNQNIGFSLSVPIFNSLSNHTNIQRAKVNQELRQNEVEQVKYEINEVVKRAYFDAQAARKAYIANDKAVKAMRESYRYSEKRYQIGVMNAIEFNQAKNNMISAEADLLRSKYDYVFKTIILDFYQGIPITLRR